MAEIDLQAGEASRGPDPSKAAAARRAERARDCSVVAFGAMGVFAILALSGALGWIEAATASVVVGAGTLAYYVGSTPAPPRRPPAAAPAARSGTERAGDVTEVLDALPMPALHVGQDGRIAAANAGARRVFKLSRSSGLYVGGAIRRPALLAAVEAAQSGARPPPVEIEVIADLDEIWLAHVAPNGARDGVLVVLEDRTDVRRARQARADFLADASHELRTPLTSVAGFIETMRGPAKDDKASWDRFLDIMSEQTERMRRLIADLLSLSRIEFSAHEAPDKVEDLAAILRREADALRPLADERGMSVQVQTPEGALPVIAYRDEMIQVVQNFLANAVKYGAEGGGVTLTCGRAETVEDARGLAGRRMHGAARVTLLNAPPGLDVACAWLRVEDDGPGIAREHLPRLGERFYRVDPSRSRETSGTGLGLAIVKHIMARHRGGMIVESAPGVGTAFGVWLPAASTAPVTRL